MHKTTANGGIRAINTSPLAHDIRQHNTTFPDFTCLLVSHSLPLQGINQTSIEIMKYSEIERKLKKSGCYWVKDGKKHPIWYSPITKKEFQLSHHKSQEAKLGTLKSISKDSGVKL